MMTKNSFIFASLIPLFLLSCSQEMLETSLKGDPKSPHETQNSPENDDFYGSTESETHIFKGRFGYDYIYERGGFDRLVFKDLSRKDLRIARTDDLLLEAKNGDKIRVVDFGLNKARQIEWISFNDKKRVELPELLPSSISMRPPLSVMSQAPSRTSERTLNLASWSWEVPQTSMPRCVG